MNKNQLLSIGGVVALIAAALIVWGVVASGDDDSTSSSSNSSAVNQVEEIVEEPFAISFTNLAPLEQGTYEGWIVRGDEKISTGLFNTDESGSVVGGLDFTAANPVDGDKVVITIEPDADTDPEPSGTVILAGDIVNGNANLEFPVDLSDFSGTYLLGTPTDDPAANETSGVWFVDNSNAPTLAASLNIPDAPEGWAYEGWIVSNGTPLTTGQFLSANGADEFNGYSGTNSAPAYPGEDFVANLPDGFTAPLELADGETKVVLSIEPRLNGVDPTGDGPAQVKPLSATIGAGVTDHVMFDLSLDASVPSGSFSVN